MLILTYCTFKYVRVRVGGAFRPTPAMNNNMRHIQEVQCESQMMSVNVYQTPELFSEVNIVFILRVSGSDAAGCG